MDPVTLIVGALAAGAASGFHETASQAVKDTYAGLKAAVAEQFSGHPRAEQALHDHAEDPVTYDRPLAKQVHETGADQDPRILALAQELVRLMASGTRANVTVHNSHGIQVGDHNNQTNNFN